MRFFLVIAFANLGLVAAAGLAEMPLEKQRELEAANIDSWTPGQNQETSRVFATLSEPIVVPEGPEDTATCQYDNGVINALPTMFGQIYGNRFSQGVGGVPLGALTLNSFSFYFADNDLSDTDLFFQPASQGTTPNAIVSRASVNVSGLVNAGASFSMLTTVNVVPQSALGTSGMFSNTFYLGAWCLNEATTLPVGNEALGLDVNPSADRGYVAASGTGIIIIIWPTVGFHAVLRSNITSSVAVPVELMAFDTED